MNKANNSNFVYWLHSRDYLLQARDSLMIFWQILNEISTNLGRTHKNTFSRNLTKQRRSKAARNFCFLFKVEFQLSHFLLECMLGLSFLIPNDQCSPSFLWIYITKDYIQCDRVGQRLIFFLKILMWLQKKKFLAQRAKM